MNDPVVLSCTDLCMTFTDAGQRLDVLRDVTLTLQAGERAAIVGASGSGKSTLVHLLGGLDKPSKGEVRVDGLNMTELGDADRGHLRNRMVGFVYQFHHLLPEFTAEENVAMPLLIRRVKPHVALAKARELLSKVGLGKRVLHKPAELSGGERQRAAVARALITDPKLVLADEPTGNLDSRNGEQIFDLMLQLNAEQGTSLLVVTHDHSLASRMGTVWTLEDGILQR